LEPERSIGKAPITLLTCGRTLTSVGFNNVLFSPLIYTNCAESAEEADSQEALEFDDRQYPRLPDNVLELRLHRRKAILRQFMAATRRMCYLILFQMTCTKYQHTGFYQLTGRIPWNDIAENPSHHLKKRSRSDSDYRLEDPSHMKSRGVDAWLQHWLKMQKKGKHPLVLKNSSDKDCDATKELKIVDRRNSNKPKARIH